MNFEEVPVFMIFFFNFFVGEGTNEDSGGRDKRRVEQIQTGLRRAVAGDVYRSGGTKAGCTGVVGSRAVVGGGSNKADLTARWGIFSGVTWRDYCR